MAPRTPVVGRHGGVPPTTQQRLNRRIDLDLVIRLPGGVPVPAKSLIDRLVGIVAMAPIGSGRVGHGRGVLLYGQGGR
jgi:hypothetical protein